MKYKVLIYFLFFVNSSLIYCYKPDCNIWCCNGKKKYQEELDKYEKCKISCYARSKRSIEDGVSGPHMGESGLLLSEYGGYSLGHPSPKPIVEATTTEAATTTKKKKKSKKERQEEKDRRISECVFNCTRPEVKTFGCSDSCCKIVEKLNNIRNGSATYQCQARCCNGRYITVRELYKRLKSEGKNLFNEILDCRFIKENECKGEGGYMVTLSNFSTICFPVDQKAIRIALSFNLGDECGNLYPNEDYSVSQLAYPRPSNNEVPNNPYGGIRRGSAMFCRMPPPSDSYYEHDY